MVARRNEDESQSIAKPIKWYEGLFIASPALIFVLSSANRVAFVIAVLLVLIGIFLNIKIYRSAFNNRWKYVLYSTVTVLLFIFYTAILIVWILLLYGRGG
jgi:heme O synthase-like polyprenyltransferase